MQLASCEVQPITRTERVHIATALIDACHTAKRRLLYMPIIQAAVAVLEMRDVRKFQ